jgi:hypothetical protein
MELRIMPSDELFEEIDTISFLISAMTNRHMFPEFRDMPQLEAEVEIARLKNRFMELKEEFYA